MIVIPEGVLSDLQKSPTLRKHFLVCVQGMLRDLEKIGKELGLMETERESDEYILSEMKKIEKRLKEMNKDGARRKKRKPS